MFDFFMKALEILQSLFSNDQLNELFDLLFGWLLDR